MWKIRNLLWIFIVVTVFIGGCSDDDDPGNQAEQDLIGTWTADKFSLDMTVEGKPIQQWLSEDAGWSDAEIEFFVDLVVDGLAEGFSGTITFNADKSYTANFGEEDPETGTWQLTNNNQNIILTDSDMDATEFEVKTLTSSSLVIGWEETETNDLDGDGTSETATMSFELTLKK